MNLINEPWIPIRRVDGTREKVEAWRITDFTEGKSPIVAIASPRPDFDGALIQFVIGLLQTTCTPSESEWWDWREKPPRPETLRERFVTVAVGFELKSETGPLFMTRIFNLLFFFNLLTLVQNFCSIFQSRNDTETSIH